MSRDPAPAEQIADFVRRYLGHHHPKDRQYLGGNLIFEMTAGWLVMRPISGRVVVTASLYGPDEHEFTGDYKGRAPSLIQQAVDRMTDVIIASHGTVDSVYPWLQDPIRIELRQRAAVLLALADGWPRVPDPRPCGSPPRSIFAAVALDGSGVWAIGDTEEEARSLAVERRQALRDPIIVGDDFPDASTDAAWLDTLAIITLSGTTESLRALIKSMETGDPVAPWCPADLWDNPTPPEEP